MRGRSSGIVVPYNRRVLLLPRTASWPGAAALAAALAGLGCASPPASTEIAGPTMGARYAVRIARRLDAAQTARARERVEARLARVDALFSTWRGDSELARFNRQAPGQPFAVSPETVAVFAAARRVHALSSGAFDVTVAPLARAWGFGPGPGLPTTPSEERLAALRPAVDQALVRLDVRAGTLTRARSDVECDLSAIAPGYAADGLIEDLAALGYRDALVDVGGELRAVGRRADGKAWRVGLDSPAGGRLDVEVPLRDAALATSGDYRNAWLDERGARRGHVLDPRTLRPVAHALAAVTVVRPSAAEADGLATALFVLGPQAGRALAEREGWAALFVVRTARGGFAVEATPAFAALTGS